MSDRCPTCQSDLRATEYAGYSVCRNGHFVSSRRWRGQLGLREIKPTVRPKRYSFIRVEVDGKRKTIDLHTAVARAFHGEKSEPHLEARHLNGDQHDNRAANLAWGTRAEQVADQVLHGTDPKGSRNGNARLTESHVSQIKKLLAEGESPTDIAPKFGCSRATVYDIRHERKWIHV